MKVSIAINNYNYSQFILEAVTSVLNQTYQNFEIIIVDDGSTDNSLELLYSSFNNDERIKIIAKKNGGQLSAFNAALEHISGEIVFFLDADDIYKENYIQSVIEVYKQNPDIDFVFCALEQFFQDGGKRVVHKYPKSMNIGFSVITTFIHKEWIGSETSAVSMRVNLLKKILPIPLESDWITRADDCLIWGSSVAGAQKFYLDLPLVEYRVHGNNNFFNNDKIKSYEYKYRRILSEEKLFTYFKNHLSIPTYMTQLRELNATAVELLVQEYLSKGYSNYKLRRKYIKIIMKSALNFKHKVKNIKKILFEKHFLDE